MALFLVTSLYDEGISPNSFRVVEADSKLAVAQHMLEQPHCWGSFLARSFHETLADQTFTPQQWLDYLEHTYVDGDSDAQLRIHEITVQPLQAVDTQPSFQPGALFSDFG